MSQSPKADFLICGAGIVGTTIALELKRRFPESKILVIEREAVGFAHSSGRNSGVIHAGFYYPPASLKAKMTAEGNRRLSNYIVEKKIPFRSCGKLVVAKNEAEHAQFSLLMDRGQKNGSDVQLLDEMQAREIEPRVKTFKNAIWSPKTRVSDPVAVLEHLQKDAVVAGIEFQFGRTVGSPSGPHVVSSDRGPINYGYLVNCAGLRADILAHAFGFGKAFKILPFKGLYLYSSAEAPKFRTNIYPVPDLNYPFLGVHVTMAMDGRSKLGPTAIPAFWREQYGGFDHFSLSDFSQISLRHSSFVLYNGKHFMNMALEEFRKYRKSYMTKKAMHLADGIEIANYRTWGRPGIRAQLVNSKTKKLEMDFMIEGDHHSLHVLNAVSPGWTCSFPFADFVCDQIEKLSQSTEAQFIREH